MKIAILGTTSHIAQNLIYYLSVKYELFLFARSPERTINFLCQQGLSGRSIICREIERFSCGNESYDAIINCIGFGTPEKQNSAGLDLFRVTEIFDNLVINFLVANPETTYINFSSGAIYGTDHDHPINRSTEFRLLLSEINAKDAYRISKLNSEAKHRIMTGYTIYDLRLFSFFSRFIDLSSNYLITEMIKAALGKTLFVTSASDIVRDYISPVDLCDLVTCCIENKGFNGVLDSYSKAPVRKSELIKFFNEQYGMKYSIVENCQPASPTGEKTVYFSEDKQAESITGYIPKFSSMESIISECRFLLSSI